MIRRRSLVVLAAAVFAVVSLLSPLPAFAVGDSVIGSAFVPGSSGYWLVTANGSVTANDGATDFGDMSGTHLNKPIVGMSATPTGLGYWLVASDGGIFAFGDAGFFGSTGAITLNKPVVGMSATPSGHGYWMVASDGGIFAFGDAGFFGSTGAMTLNKPVVGMSATTSGLGYWLVASDGGIFAYGDAAFFGSTGGMQLNEPVVAMAASSTGGGYWLAAADGGVFAFGDASFVGSGSGEVTGHIATFVPETSGGYNIVDSRGRVLRFPGSTKSKTTTTTTAPSTGGTTTTTTTAPATGGTTTTTTTPVFTTIPTITLAPTTNDLNGWKYLFGDSFDTNAPSGSFLSTYKNWGAYDTGWPDTSHRGIYDTSALSVSNGTLNINVHTGPDGKPRAAVPYPYINGANAADKWNQTYGRYEVRFRADAVQGYKTAFLLWPKSEVWPRDGEIDFPEGNLTGHIEAFAHHQGATSGGDQDGYSTSTTYTDWHTAVTEWTPNYVRFILDGNVIGTSTTRVPNTPMHWVLQTETCLDDCSIPASANGNVQIDYVKAWKYSPTTVVN